jgi:hypothetical protein
MTIMDSNPKTGMIYQWSAVHRHNVARVTLVVHLVVVIGRTSAAVKPSNTRCGFALHYRYVTMRTIPAQ